MKKLLLVVTLIWLAVLLRITVFRDGCFSNGFFSGRIEWNAFEVYLKLAKEGDWKYIIYLFVGNLIWFVPAGILSSLWGWKLWQALLFGFLLSLGIETAQYVLGSGISDLGDLILNTIGALLGYLGTGLFLKLSRKNQGANTK